MADNKVLSAIRMAGRRSWRPWGGSWAEAQPATAASSSPSDQPLPGGAYWEGGAVVGPVFSPFPEG